MKGDSLTGFKTDLLQYLAAYRSPKLAPWEKHIQAHDMASAKYVFKVSFPIVSLYKVNINNKLHKLLLAYLAVSY